QFMALPGAVEIQHRLPVLLRITEIQRYNAGHAVLVHQAQAAAVARLDDGPQGGGIGDFPVFSAHGAKLPFLWKTLSIIPHLAAVVQSAIQRQPPPAPFRSGRGCWRYSVK